MEVEGLPQLELEIAGMVATLLCRATWTATATTSLTTRLRCWTPSWVWVAMFSQGISMCVITTIQTIHDCIYFEKLSMREVLCKVILFYPCRVHWRVSSNCFIRSIDGRQAGFFAKENDIFHQAVIIRAQRSDCVYLYYLSLVCTLYFVFVRNCILLWIIKIS